MELSEQDNLRMDSVKFASNNDADDFISER